MASSNDEDLDTLPQLVEKVDMASSNDEDLDTLPQLVEKVDTLVRYLADPRNPETAAAFHELVNDVLGIRRAQGDDSVDVEDDADDQDSSTGDGGKGDGAAATSAAAATTKTAKKTK